MSLESLQGLLNTFGGGIGLDGLRADDEGYCCLSFDEVTAHLQYDEGEDELLVFTRLGKIDDDAPARLHKMLLEANLFWRGTGGGTLGLQPEDGTVFLGVKTPMCVLDQPHFEELLERFIDTAENWRAKVESYASDEAVATGEMPADTGSSPDSDVIRV